MRTRLIRIGRSQGILIPRPLLEQTGLRDEVEIGVQGDALIIRPARRARAGWAEAFREMARRGDDAPLDDAPQSSASWDEQEWEW